MPVTSMHESSISFPPNVIRIVPRAALRIVGVRSPYAGDTWGDFVRAMAEAGVRPSDLLGSIEFGVALRATGRLCVERDDNGAIDVREAR